MHSLIETALHGLRNSTAAAVLLDVSLKSFVVLAIAGGLCLTSRRASPATRHLIWFLAMASLPLLPLGSSLLPSWNRPLWTVSSELNSANQLSVSIELVPVRDSKAASHQPAAVAAGNPRVGDGHARPESFNARLSANRLAATAIIWLGGAMCLLVPILAGRSRLRALSRDTRRVQDQDWNALLLAACDDLQIRRAVVLLQSAENIMPLTWGWRRPVILLPADSDRWSEDRRGVVVLHELAHVKRRDSLTQLVAEIVRAFYWFNPLAWVATRQMRIERERACDDLVLNGGCKASDYAVHLVEIASTFRPVPGTAAIAMARTSGLEQRVTAILNGNTQRNRIAKTAVTFVALAIVALELLVGGYAQQAPSEPWSIEHSKVGDHLKKFVAEKRAQTVAASAAEGKEVLPEYEAMYAAATKGDWNAISNVWENLRARAPQYLREGSGAADPRLHGTGWQTMLEIWGGFGNIIVGGEEKFVSIGQGIIDSIPRGSIYFGGTDPGRCVVTALQESHVNADPFFTLTQNALADGTYLQYLRGMYGGKIYTPSEDDSQKCFTDYVSDVSMRLAQNKLRPGESATQSADGKVKVSGQVAVMSINALLARKIFDRNPDREFYIEESFPLDWMYPYLEPHGLIMKINREPAATLSDEVLQADRKFWTDRTAGVIGIWLDADTPTKTLADYATKTYGHVDTMSTYIPPESANKWLSKLRASIAGVYAWRAEHAGNEAEKLRMSREADLAFRQAWAICPYSPEALFRYANLLVSQGRTADASVLADASAAIDRNNIQMRDLAEHLKQSKAAP